MGIYVDNKKYTDAIVAKYGVQTSDALSMVKADLDAIIGNRAPRYLTLADYATDFIGAYTALSEAEKEAAFAEAILECDGPAEVIHEPGSVTENHGVNPTTGEFE